MYRIYLVCILYVLANPRSAGDETSQDLTRGQKQQQKQKQKLAIENAATIVALKRLSEETTRWTMLPTVPCSFNLSRHTMLIFFSFSSHSLLVLFSYSSHTFLILFIHIPLLLFTHSRRSSIPLRRAMKDYEKLVAGVMVTKDDPFLKALDSKVPGRGRGKKKSKQSPQLGSSAPAAIPSSALRSAADDLRAAAAAAVEGGADMFESSSQLPPHAERKRFSSQLLRGPREGGELGATAPAAPSSSAAATVSVTTNSTELKRQNKLRCTL